MALFSVEIADQDVPRVLNALAANYNWSEFVDNPSFDPLHEESDSNPRLINNPETQAAFANRMVRRFLAEHVKAYEVKLAKQQAQQNASAEVQIADPQAV